jgi:hypothetical protein
VSYSIKVTGTYRYDVGEPGEFADAQYREDDNNRWTIRWNSVEFNGIRLSAYNTSFNENHTYTFFVSGTGQPMTFRIYDGPGTYGDNVGNLMATISRSCSVPFFWQRDPTGTNAHPLRGTCGTSYDTLGEGGCTLTSATMLFRHYGANTTTDGAEMTPANLSDCMNNNACPFSWISGASCSDDKASDPRRYSSFSYERLDQELNQNQRPVILQMCKKSDCSITHWVLVTGGQGTEPENYTIWDPWFKCGQNMRLNSRSDTWNFIGTAVFDGTPTCSFSSEVPLCARSASPVGLPSGNVAIVEQVPSTLADLNASSSVSGSAVLYRATSISMTVELTAQSSISNVTEMLIWSDTLSNTVWQPFASYVWLPQSNMVYGRFRDAAGNVSEVVSDTINPSAPPVASDPVRIQLPLVRR